MDYGRRELADRLAAEYVLGTLRGPARRRFEALLPAHPALRESVASWREQLLPLAASVPPVAPPDRVWAGIERQLFAAKATATSPPAASRWWQRLGPWRALSGVATAAALALVLVLNQVPPPQPPVVIVLAANPEVAATFKASFVASISGDGRALVLRPLDPVPLQAGRALELWAVPPSGAPRSLGLVGADRATTLVRTRLLADTAAFAISVEPAGGSPTGAPTGPIVSVGPVRL